jgi:hypothetical protein
MRGSVRVIVDEKYLAVWIAHFGHPYGVHIDPGAELKMSTIGHYQVCALLVPGELTGLNQ